MFNAFLEGRIAKAERTMGVSLDYVRFIAGASRGALWRLMRFTGLTRVKPGPLSTPLHVSAIVASQAEDCGSCVQIAVNFARQAGVDGEIIRTVLAAEPDRLSEDLRDVYYFARGVTLNTQDQETYRERIRERYGDAGLVEISMALALHRAYPTLKRALGYATSCSRVTIKA